MLLQSLRFLETVSHYGELFKNMADFEWRKGITLNGKKKFAIFLICGVSILILLMETYGVENTWKIWRFPLINVSFGDAGVLTGGVEAYRQGYDPLVTRMPTGLFNYPRIWLCLHVFGIGIEDTIYVGILFGSLFFIGVWLFVPNDIDRISILLMISIAFSNAILLGVERGNTDLLIFFLISLFIVMINYSFLGAAGILLVSFILKLYPIFAAMALIKNQKEKNSVRAVGLIIGFGVVYAWLNIDELMLIRAATPKDVGDSYGINILWMKAAIDPIGIGSIVRIVSYLVVAATIGWSFFSLRVDKTIDDFIRTDYLAPFRVGCGIYIGTFFIGNNFDYRLMFLLFAIPQLSLWAQNKTHPFCRRARWTLLAVLISVWMIFGLVGRQLSQWLIFINLTYLTFHTFPAWLRNEVKTLLNSRC